MNNDTWIRTKQRIYMHKGLSGCSGILLIVMLCMALQGDAQRVLTLEEAIATALQNNYDIRLSKNDAEVAALDYQYRNAVFLPKVDANAGTTWTANNSRQEYADGATRSGNVNTNNLNASLTLDWTLFDGMKMFVTRDKAEQYIQLGDKVVRNQVTNTVAQVVNTYYNIVRQKQQLLAIEEQMRLSQSRVDLTQRRLEIGAGAKPEVLQSQVDLNAQKAAQLSQQTYIEQLKESLNQLMFPEQVSQSTGAPPEYDVTETIPINVNLSLEEIQNQLDEQNPILDITRKNIEIAKLSLKEIRAERWPTLEFNSAFNFSRTNNTLAINPFLPLINQNRGFNYGFTASVPILNYRNNHRMMRQAELNIGYQQLVYENQRAALRLDVLNAYRDFEMQKKALALEEENILLAKENVEIIQEVYRLGGATFVQLREAEKSLGDAYDRLIAARYNIKLAETELMRLKGDLGK
jgi:outer membrane protein